MPLNLGKKAPLKTRPRAPAETTFQGAIEVACDETYGETKHR